MDNLDLECYVSAHTGRFPFFSLLLIIVDASEGFGVFLLYILFQHFCYLVPFFEVLPLQPVQYKYDYATMS